MFLHYLKSRMLLTLALLAVESGALGYFAAGHLTAGNVLFFALAGCVLAASFWLGVEFGLTRPLGRITNAALELTQGSVQARLEYTSRS